MVHKNDARYPLKILIVTVSATRTSRTDTSGDNIKRLFEDAGYKTEKVIVRDDETEILRSYFCNIDFDVYVFVGGTGASKFDLTVESLRKIATKKMEGFGELFRSKSSEDFAYMSDASLFTRGRQQLYCVPGSPDAIGIAFSTISSLMNHIHHELTKE